MGLEAPWRVDDALRHARSVGLDRLDALLLLGRALQRDRSWLMAHGEHVLTPEEVAGITFTFSRRAQGVPLSYLVGQREFHGLMLKVTQDVLDPRPDTETLVDWALEGLGQARPVEPRDPPVRVMDLGTGSGAIALALQAARPDWEVHASDASAAALAVARGNAQALGLPVRFHEGSWWDALPQGLRLHLAVSNPPYIRPDDPHLVALVHEPRSALVAEDQGLADLRALIEGAHAHLLPGGWLLLEHGHDQAEPVARLLAGAGFESIGHRRDLAGHTRCTGGRLAG